MAATIPIANAETEMRTIPKTVVPDIE
jgi:hypothetical protein